MIGVNARDQFPAVLRQVNNPRAPVTAGRTSLDQIFRLQPVDGDGNGATRQQHFLSDFVNRQRPFVNSASRTAKSLPHISNSAMLFCA
jgi:hypothetical protein